MRHDGTPSSGWWLWAWAGIAAVKVGEWLWKRGLLDEVVLYIGWAIIVVGVLALREPALFGIGAKTRALAIIAVGTVIAGAAASDERWVIVGGVALALWGLAGVVAPHLLTLPTREMGIAVVITGLMVTAAGAATLHPVKPQPAQSAASKPTQFKEMPASVQPRLSSSSSPTSSSRTPTTATSTTSTSSTAATVRSAEPEPASPFTAEEQEYGAAMYDHARRMLEVTMSLSTLLRSPAPFDPEWRIEVAAYLAELEMLAEEGKEIRAPDSLKDVHAKYVKALEHMGRVPELLAEGIDTFNPDLIEQATSEMLKGGELMAQCAEELEKWQEERGR